MLKYLIAVVSVPLAVNLAAARKDQLGLRRSLAPQQARSVEWRARFSIGLVVGGVIATIFWIILLCAILVRLLVAELA
jgi:hypothetical protein